MTEKLYQLMSVLFPPRGGGGVRILVGTFEFKPLKNKGDHSCRGPGLFDP